MKKSFDVKNWIWMGLVLIGISLMIVTGDVDKAIQKLPVHKSTLTAAKTSEMAKAEVEALFPVRQANPGNPAEVKEASNLAKIFTDVDRPKEPEPAKLTCREAYASYFRITALSPTGAVINDHYIRLGKPIPLPQSALISSTPESMPAAPVLISTTSRSVKMKCGNEIIDLAAG